MLPLVVVILASLSKNTIIPGVSAGKYVLSIEPYIAEWCAGQFGSLPTASGLFEATNGEALSKMITKRSYNLAEEYFGGYCFDVFGRDQLKDQNREDTLYELSKRGIHVEIEPYLMEWGQEATLSGEVPDLEHYVTNWCVKGQFRDFMPDQTKAFEIARRHPNKIEVALAPWCWKQFPNEMKDLDQNFYISRMKTNRVKIEPYLMKWEITNFHVRNHPGMQIFETEGGGGFWGFFRFMLVIMGLVGGIGYVQKNHPHVTEAASGKVQQMIIGVGSSLQQPLPPRDFQYSSMPMTENGNNRLNENLM